MNIELTPTQLVAGGGVLLALGLIWRVVTRWTRRAAGAARASARVVSWAERVALMAAIILGVQWVVITHSGNTMLLLVVLAAPDLIAGHVLTRSFTVTSMDTTRRGGGHR